MPARPRSARAGTEGNHSPTRPPIGVRGLCPRTFSAKRVPNTGAKAKLSRGAELGPVTLLELLAAAAPAGIVPADVVAFRVDDRTRRAGGRRRPAAACH